MLVKKAIGTVLGRWVTGGVVTLLLGLAFAAYTNYKEGLRDEGKLECVQEIQQATVDALEEQLRKKDEAIAVLRELHAKNLVLVEERKQREQEAYDRLEGLERQIEEQRNADPNYREWADTDLPDGVADRLREAAGSAADDSN
jgi:TolA-binding protein